jgi:pimeloyl-ACP methyl ester carboxylesterase
MRCVIRWTFALLLLPLPAAAQDRIDLPTRPGVIQPIYVTTVPNPAATVLLFPGDQGVVAKVRNNFLLRTAPDFVALGLSVAVIDAPSDQSNGMSDEFRMSAAHATDVAAVIAAMRQRAEAPIWLVGTSRGTISAASLAVRLGPPQVAQGIAGVVLTSTVWQSAVSQVRLEDIRVPTLILHNRNDGCVASPYGLAGFGLRRLSAAPSKELIAVSSSAQRSAPCDAMSPHGYLGIEQQVVQLIAAWIKAH